VAALLTPEQVVRRWSERGMSITVETLLSWRFGRAARRRRRGPPCQRREGRILYPLDLLEAWEARKQAEQQLGPPGRDEGVA
jgi:hypothetical protein